MIVGFHPAALQEMREAEWYIEECRSRWGAKFRAEVAAVIDHVREKATASEAFMRRKTGSMKVRRFPYRVYFRILPEELRIRAVYHNKRREGGWKSRKFG